MRTKKIFVEIYLGALLASINICCRTSDPSGGSDPYADARRLCVEKINSFRATLDLPPLDHWSEKDKDTDDQARFDSEIGIAHSAFGACGEEAQNECPYYRSVEAIIETCLDQQWDEGPGEPYSEHGHYINMTNPQYTKISVGFYVSLNGDVWGIQNFYR